MNLKPYEEQLLKLCSSKGFVLGALLISITSIFSIFLYPNLIISKRIYHPGDVVKRDIKAPEDFIIEDTKATEARRREAQESALTLYDYDEAMADRVIQRVNQAFVEVQSVIRAEPLSASSAEMLATGPTVRIKREISRHDRIWLLKDKFQDTLGIPVSNGAYQILEKENFSSEISDRIGKIVKKILDIGVVTNKEMLLKESDSGIILRSVGSGSEKHILNLKNFYGLDQAKAMVWKAGQPFLENTEYTTRNLIVNFVQRLLTPNITLNRSETEQRGRQAAADVKPVLYKIKAGEMLLREGERVTELHLLKLKDLRNQTKGTELATRSIGAALIILLLLITAYILYFKDRSTIQRDHTRNMLFIAAILVTFLFVTKISAALPKFMAADMPFSLKADSIVFGIPIAAGAMTICLFIGMETALPFAALLAIFSAIIFQDRLEILVFFLLSSSMAAYWIQQCKERQVFIKAGVKLALLNTGVAAAINLYTGDISSSRLLWDCTFAAIGGIASGIVTAGIAPLVELIFNYTTDIKLLELANLERPILRRLMIEAPGSYNHSVIVSSMAEVAAAEIGCNPLLAKVCGYYHDIGKLKKPLYFIENQKDCKNRHDKLAPSMSALILMSHIKDGVDIARKHKLGQAIIDTIQQHHGTSLIRYFYEKARQQKGADGLNMNDFRYPGPKPQTREIGIVMLADVVEAASRTLDNPTSARIQGLVQNLFNKIFADGQLDECELTLKDLHKIAKSFNKMLNGIYHHRIRYPEKTTSTHLKGKNGHIHKEQPGQVQTSSRKNPAEGTDHLKRIGIS